MISTNERMINLNTSGEKSKLDIQNVDSGLVTKTIKTIIGFDYHDYFLKIKLTVENSKERIENLKLLVEKAEGRML